MGEKNAIFGQRIQLKKHAKEVVKTHYVLMVFLVLLLMLFGTEFQWTTIGMGKLKNTGAETLKNPGSILDEVNIGMLPFGEVITAAARGQIRTEEERAAMIQQWLMEKGDKNKALARRNGVLAALMNGVGSGMIFVRAAQTLRSVVGSDVAVSVIMTVLSFLWYLLIFMFFRNLLSAAARRLLLEARVYKRVYFLDIMHFAAVHRWAKAAWAMLVATLLESLWWLTIVGGFIKTHSYFAVPYIIAENPDVGALEAVKLSRKMMDGHKMELFKYEMSMIGWILLGFVTFGISEAIWGGPYRLAAYSEFYAKIREKMLEKEPETAKIFNDPYLFKKADKISLYETYFEVVDEITLIHESRITLTGARKKVADWFGIWIGSINSKKAYDEQEGREFALTHYKECMNQEAYPQWFNPLWTKRKLAKRSDFTFIRNYTVFTLFLLFITFSFVGWSWEVALHLMQTGEFANRGTLHGPWLPIYGTGGVIVLILCSRFRKNPVLEFFTAVALCGCIEYFSGWYLETKFHTRWWSYDGYFLNLHGRICAEGLLVFGVGCCVVVYLLAPIFDYLLSMLKKEIMLGICAVLAVLFLGDQIYSSRHPNMAKGAVETAPEETQAIQETEIRAAG